MTELLMASLIALYVIAGAWMVYIMGWRWWYEIMPTVEAQRTARITLQRIVEGVSDDSTGTYRIGGITYTRRNGIAQAIWQPDISPDGQMISYGLEPDGANTRTFFLWTDPGTGLNVLCYGDGLGPEQEIPATLGITAVTFEDLGSGLVRVTAVAERNVIGTRSVPLHINVSYNEIVCLKNVPG